MTAPNPAPNPARSPARRFGRPSAALLYRHCGDCSALVPLTEWQEGPLGCDDCRRAGASARAGIMTPPTEAPKMSVTRTIRTPVGLVEFPQPAICIGLGEGARRARRTRAAGSFLKGALVAVLLAGAVAALHSFGAVW